MNRPLVSVIMPVYNGEKYIKRAVESVYEQGISLEKNLWEIIIIVYQQGIWKKNRSYIDQ